MYANMPIPSALQQLSELTAASCQHLISPVRVGT